MGRRKGLSPGLCVGAPAGPRLGLGCGVKLRAMLLGLSALGAVWPCAAQVPPPAAGAPASAALILGVEVPADTRPDRALWALFARHREHEARSYPEGATYRGDLRFNDQLTDESEPAVAARDAAARDFLAQARAVRPEDLSPQDRVSLALFTGRLAREVEFQSHPGPRSLLIGANDGLQSEFADLLKASPVETVEQVEQMLRRMHAFPRQLDAQIGQLRRGKALGWVSSQAVVRSALRQFEALLPADTQAGPFFAPFRTLGASIPPAQQERLRAAGLTAIEQAVAPALRRLQAFLTDEYLPAAPASGAWSSYPDGRRAYELMVRNRTTTALTASGIHAIGLRELARIRGEMEDIRVRTGFKGDFTAFVEWLNTDPRFFHIGPEALLTGYRDIAKRIDAQLPRLFAELPRAPYGVRAMPAFRGPNAAEYYDGPALDGTRGGWFNANTAGWRSRPTWRMATLTAHEAVPGHHLQIARAVELRGLPEFRRGGGYTAFVEGWAVYAETLGRDIGLYEDPYDLFGHLQWQALRAARLVVDTGLHSLGWHRQQAIDFMVERTGMDRAFLTQEVDRYTSWPGQALGYMIGKLKIEELRDRAKARLGARFDIRRFHNAVIDQGALPLDVLEQQIDEWMERELAGKR